MIKTTSILLDEYAAYSNPSAKIAREVRSGNIIPIIRGLYESDRNIPGYYLANIIYGPSYLSFEYALSRHGLIPEAVYTFTSATCDKGKKKRYDTSFGYFTYRDVPARVFPYGNDVIEENGYIYILATPEKALCDLLYTCSPCSNRRELRTLLFEDLRIDEDAFLRIDQKNLEEIAELYHNKNHKLLISLTKEIRRNEQHYRADAVDQ